MKRSFWIIATTVLLVAAALSIFAFSAQPGEASDAISLRVARFFVVRLHPEFESLSAQEQGALLHTANVAVRKAAHFAEYLLFGAILSMHLRLILPQHGLGFVAGSAFSLGVLYAVFDEWHQFFVSGRTMRLFDLAVDSAGLLCGVAAVSAAAAFFGRKQKRF